MRTWLVILACLIVFSAVPSQAGHNTDGKVAVHVLPHQDRTCSKAFPVISYCGEIITTYEGCGDMDFFPVFFDLSDYTGMNYGMIWPGSGSCLFTSCSDFKIGDILWSGDGIAQVWSECQAEPVGIPGWGWINCDEAGEICVVEHPGNNMRSVADCEYQEDQIDVVYCAGVCGAEGMDPCEGPPPYTPLAVDISLSVGGGCIFVGDDMTYTIPYGNPTNPGSANGVVLTASFSPHTIFLNASGNGQEIYGERVRWNIGSLVAGQTGTARFTVRVKQVTPPGTLLPASATISCNEAPDSTAAETTMVCVEEFAPLGLTKDDGIGADEVAIVGDWIVYKIRFDNIGNAREVSNIRVVDYLADKSTFVSASDGGVYNSGLRTVTWDTGTLAGGATDSVELTTAVGYGATDQETIINSCSVKGDETRTTRVNESTRVIRAKVAIYVRPHKYWHKCGQDIPPLDICQDIRQYSDSCDVTVYPVFFDMGGVQGLEYSMVWPGDWGSMTFYSCSDATIGDIVNPWDSVVQTWNECQQKDYFMPAVCHVTGTGPGQIRVAEHWNSGMIGITTCRENKYQVLESFPGGVCGEYVDHPCGSPTRVEPVTWGRIKAMFR